MTLEQHSLGFPPRKTPTAYRSFSTVLICLFAASPLAAGQVLDESDVIRIARDHSPASAIASAADSLATARSRTAGLLPNPSVSWSRETVESGAVGSQDIVSATLPIDVVRPRATRALVASQGAWTRAEAAMSFNDAIRDAVLAYYDVTLAQKRIDVLMESVTRFEEAARILQRREAAGSASGYESARLAVADELSRSRLAEAQGLLASARVRLSAHLGLPVDSLQTTGSITLISAAEETRLASRGGASREAVRRADASRRFARQARDRASWAWLPTLQLEGGFKHVSDLGGGYGYVVGVSLSIPIFDRGQGLRAQAEAMQMLATARSDALSRVVDTQIRTALTAFRAARQELARFDSRTPRHVESLLTAAQSGYREGKRTIVELLDAQRAHTVVAERRVALLGAAKRAEVQLRAATGELR